MRSFRHFFLEYYKGNAILNPKQRKGKDPNRAHMRKHANTIRKEDDYADPLVKSVARGSANGVIVPYDRLMKILKIYNIAPEPGTKILGNSKVSVVISMNSDNKLVGKLERRK